MQIAIELKNRKIPIVRVDSSLNVYDDKILFPDKLEKANAMLKKTGLPKQWTSELNNHQPIKNNIIWRQKEQ